MNLAKAVLIFNTLKYLKPSQAFYFALNRGLGFRSVPDVSLPDSYTINLNLSSPNYKSTFSEVESKFTFLNHSRSVSLDNIDWCPLDAQRLWRYNLHYFDFLSQDDVSDSAKSLMINSWIENNDQGAQPAWEPYTASLRIVNWVKYFSGKAIVSHWHNSLFLQTRWLRKNLELHILANHYFENIKALTFSALYFYSLKDPLAKEVEEWLRYALKNLSKQLKEQFLEDGGHYERTPSYHILLIFDCLELYELLKSVNRKIDFELSGLLDQLQAIIQKGVFLACQIARPDSLPPLFRDSAFDSCPPLHTLVEYASELGIGIPEQSQLLGKFGYEQFGVYGFKSQSDWLAINAAPIGPSYQPGHTHCDMLSYELYHAGFPVIVDSGVYEYEPGKNRKYFRSTAAHNTVAVAGKEQSEIWGEFRVGRRASSEFVEFCDAVNDRGERELIYRGEVVGYCANESGTHQREIKLIMSADNETINNMKVIDSLVGQGSKISFTSINFHPDVDIVKKGGGCWNLLRSGRLLGEVRLYGEGKVTLLSGQYSPKFGEIFKAKKIQIGFKEKIEINVVFSKENTT